MKKTLKLSLTLVLAFVMLFAVAIIASAETTPTDSGECGYYGDNVTWEYYQDTQTIVLSGTGWMKSYVNTSDAPWYKYRSVVTNLEIEEGITSIGKSTFTGFTALKSLVIPDSVAEINRYAFMNCTALETVEIGTGVTLIADSVFAGCSKIKGTYIKDLAAWCGINFVTSTSNPISRGGSSDKKLYLNGELVENLVIPAEVTRIEGYAFYSCYSLKSVTLHDNIEFVGKAAFTNCNYVTALTLDNCTFSTGTMAFNQMSRLTNVYVNNLGAYSACKFSTSGGNPLRAQTIRAAFALVVDGVRLVKDVAQATKGQEAVKLVFPENTTKLENQVFFYRQNLTEAVIPASVTSINGDTAGSRNKGAFNYAKLYTIYGEAGSYAETFATNNGYRFVAITPVEVTGISLDKASAELTVGSTLNLAATVTPADATFNQVIWTSSDMDVASVSAGKVTALSAGTATITAKTSNGAFSATCVITVPEIKVTGVALDKDAATLAAGHTLKLVPTFTPANASNKEIVWTSSNNAIATVANGIVSPVANGTVTITATTVDGGFEATCEVTVVIPAINVTGVALDTTAATLKVAETVQLTATVSPADADNKDVVWTTENADVATVVNGLVTAVGAGTTNIVVTTVDGSFEAMCTITVEEEKEEIVPVEEFVLDVEELEIVFGETYQFEVIFTPDNTTQRDLFWESTNEDIATIDQDGLLTAIAPGETVITVFSNDNEDLYAECYVIVTAGKPVEGIALDKTSANVYLGDIVNLAVTFTPADATNKNVTWTSSNDAIVTVENGVVTAVGGGVATVTVTSEDGEFTATCKFIVAVGNETPPIEWN